MANYLLVVTIGMLALAATGLASLTAESDSFDNFVKKYSRAYATRREYEQRRAVFERNLRHVARLNAQELKAGRSAVYGVTEFFDRTPTEFGARRGKLLPEDVPADAYVFDPRRLSELPSVVDWRKDGAVTPVPNQGDCGSIICGFGFATNTEGVNKIQNGKLVALSAQEGMACYEETCGCYLHGTYNWFLTNQSGWVDTEASWPYNQSQCEVAVCDLSHRTRGAQINAVIAVPKSEAAIKAEVAVGPVTVAVMVQQWQFYTGGVMSNCGWGQPDHVATIVGYNDDAKPAYWILKNWWGVDWGLDGYIYLEQGTNQCNMTYEPLTVRVPKA